MHGYAQTNFVCKNDGPLGDMAHSVLNYVSSLSKYARALFCFIAKITKQLRKQEPCESRTSIISLRHYIKVVSLHKYYSGIRELDITNGCVLLTHITQASCKGNKGKFRQFLGIFGIAD